MEDSMDMENLAPLRPQNFLFGCELKADKKEYAFKVDDDENDHQLSLKTEAVPDWLGEVTVVFREETQGVNLDGVALGVGAKDELHIVEAEGMNYHAKPIKIVLASLKPSVQPTVSLGGFEITPPVTLRLKAGSGPVYVSGQHLIALEEGLESSDEEEEEEEDDNAGIVKNAKRAAAASTSKVPQKKAKIEADDDEDDFDEDDDEDDDDEEDEDEDEDEEEETPVKKPSQAAKPKSAQKSNHNGKLSEPSTPAKPAKTPEQKGKQEAKQQSPKTPKTPFTPEEIKAKMQVTLEKGGALPKIEPKFTNYVKNCFRMDDQKVIQDLWKWRQSLKDK